MHITIDVNIKGLEGLLPTLQQFLASSQTGASQNSAPVTTTTVATVTAAPQPAITQNTPVQNVVQMPALAATPQVGTSAPVQEPIQMQPAQIQTAVPVATAPSYTLDQLAVAATQLMDAGRQNDLVNLLAGFGVQALTQLPKEQFGNFATQLRAMGAKI